MKMRIFLLLVVLLFITTHAGLHAETKDNGEWYPFYFPEKLDPDSPLNIGKLVLDAPAGKHGFVKVKDGHFYFEDGTRAKFWGTNLCFSACFPTHKQAEILADRIAYFGFNAVRLHHMDFYFEPNGIFEDVCPTCKDPQMKKTGVLSKTQLDKLDYLIHQLKQRGIYVDMNLLVSRRFTKADGIIDADRLGMAAKPYSMFDPKLIELQKQYAKDLLTHHNPYTQLEYCDDPAVALIEITNENTVFTLKNKILPPHYQYELNKLREAKLMNIVQSKKNNEDFYTYLDKKYLNQMRIFLKNNLKIKVPIGVGGHWLHESWNAQDDESNFVDRHAYWDHPEFPNQSWNMDDFKIHNKSAILDNNLGIINQLIKSQPKDKPYMVTEWNHCYPNRYTYETPILLACTATKNNWDGLCQFAFSHGWNFEPDFNDIHSYFDTISNPQKLILTSLGGLIFLKEANVENVLKEGIFSASSPSLNAVVGFIKNKPQILGPFIITANQDGAVVLLNKNNKYILLGISEVGNSESGWNSEGKFSWGKAPVFLKRINIKVQHNGKSILVNFARSPWVEIKL